MAKKALIVIDMQNDYLWEKRMKKFSYNTEKLVGDLNSLIDKYSADGCEVVYIKHIIQNLWTNRLIFGYSIANTEGAELYGGLKKVSDNVFEKLLPDAFTSKAFKKFIQDGGYTDVAITGIDECGCVSATAKGAIKNGLNVEMVKSGIATVFPQSKAEKLRAELKAMGAKYTD